MAKVAVTVPDDVLRAIDVEARRRGTTRSDALARLVGSA
jgi:metal-responsive CopG/Arc/MetJ family transcriptional regulator